jgi:hypothetical protein
MSPSKRGLKEEVEEKGKKEVSSVMKDKRRRR